MVDQASVGQVYDVVIIGGGPAGLSAALMLGRSCRQVILVDAGEQRNAAARELHGFLGRDGTDPRDLLRQGRIEVAKYAVAMLTDTVNAAVCLAATKRFLAKKSTRRSNDQSANNFHSTSGTPLRTIDLLGASIAFGGRPIRSLPPGVTKSRMRCRRKMPEAPLETSARNTMPKLRN